MEDCSKELESVKLHNIILVAEISILNDEINKLKTVVNKEVKRIENVKAICLNIRENGQPLSITSFPDCGVVNEFHDRYEFDVIHEHGLSLMQVYKKDFFSVEILLK